MSCSPLGDRVLWGSLLVPGSLQGTSPDAPWHTLLEVAGAGIDTSKQSRRGEKKDAEALYVVHNIPETLRCCFSGFGALLRFFPWLQTHAANFIATVPADFQRSQHSPVAHRTHGRDVLLACSRL